MGSNGNRLELGGPVNQAFQYACPVQPLPFGCELSLCLASSNRMNQQWPWAGCGPAPEEGLAVATFTLLRVAVCEVRLSCWKDPLERERPRDDREKQGTGLTVSVEAPESDGRLARPARPWGGGHPNSSTIG